MLNALNKDNNCEYIRKCKLSLLTVAIFVLLLLRSKSQPDPAGPKHVAVKTFYIKNVCSLVIGLFVSPYFNTQV